MESNAPIYGKINNGGEFSKTYLESKFVLLGRGDMFNYLSSANNRIFLTPAGIPVVKRWYETDIDNSLTEVYCLSFAKFEGFDYFCLEVITLDELQMHLESEANERKMLLERR